MQAVDGGGFEVLAEEPRKAEVDPHLECKVISGAAVFVGM